MKSGTTPTLFLIVLALAACERRPTLSHSEHSSIPAPGTTSPNAQTAPDSTKAAAEETTPGTLEVARALRNAGRLAEAEAGFRKHLAEQPTDSLARVELAEIIVWNGKHEEATRLIEGLDASTGGPRLVRVRGDLAVIEKRIPEAITHYHRHLESEPADDLIRFRLAEALSWEQRYDESLREYEALLEKRPDDLPLRRKYGQVLGWAGRYMEAADQLRRTLP